MLRVKAQVEEINYDSLVELMMPYLIKWLSEQDRLFYDVISKLISKEGRPNRFSKFIFSKIPKKSELAVWILPRFNELLLEYCNTLLTHYQIIGKVMQIKVWTAERSNKSMLKIEIVVDELDYERTADNLLPVILQQLSEKEDESSKLPKLLISLKRLPRQVLQGAIRAIPKEERDDVTALFLNEYKDELTELMNKLLISNNIKAEVQSIHVDTK